VTVEPPATAVNVGSAESKAPPVVVLDARVTVATRLPAVTSLRKSCALE
jgi:hypothetical protein